MRISKITILVIIILVIGTVGLGVYFSNFSFDLRGRASGELEFNEDKQLLKQPYIRLKTVKGEMRVGEKVKVGVFVKSVTPVAEVYVKLKYPVELLRISEAEIVQGQELPVIAIDRAGDGEIGFLLFRPEIKREPAQAFTKETQIAILDFTAIKTGKGELMLTLDDSGIYGPRVDGDQGVVNLLEDAGGTQVSVF